MKVVLISIKPKWCDLIRRGRKTVEVRKTCPKLEVPFKVYIYETMDGGRGSGLVFGEFVCIGFDVFRPIGKGINLMQHGGTKSEPETPRSISVKLSPTFCAYCGKPLKIVGTERFCNNVQCFNRFQNV